MSVNSNASLCPSATTVTIQYLFPRCLPCLSVTVGKCTFLRKYAFLDPCLLDFFSCFGGYYSVFLFLRWLTYKLPSEVGCGEVTSPKQPVRERDRQSPTVLHITTCASTLRWWQCYFIATQKFAERSELGKFLARMGNFRRHRQVVYCLIGQRRFNLSPLPWIP